MNLFPRLLGTREVLLSPKRTHRMAEGVVFQRRMVQEQVLVAQDPPPWTLEGGNVAVQAA